MWNFSTVVSNQIRARANFLKIKIQVFVATHRPLILFNIENTGLLTSGMRWWPGAHSLDSNLPPDFFLNYHFWSKTKPFPKITFCLNNNEMPKKVFFRVALVLKAITEKNLTPDKQKISILSKFSMLLFKFS